MHLTNPAPSDSMPALLTEMAGSSRSNVLELTDRPDTRRQWTADIRRHLDVLIVLSKKDFQTRYKRTSLGLAWAVIVPVIQGSIMALVFSHVVRTVGGYGYAIYVMSGVAAFFYFSQTLNAAVPSIVDGATMTDKVWFPRAILVMVPGIANLIGLVTTFLFLIAILPVLGGHYSPDLLLLVPALMLLVAFTTALALVLSALHVYFRDVKFLVQAVLIVWIYATPIMYPISITHQLVPFIVANPLTGIVALIHLATLGTSRGALGIPLGVSIGATIVLLIVGLEAQRVRDRLFVDLL